MLVTEKKTGSVTKVSLKGLTKEQLCSLGSKLYQDRIKDLVEPQEKGKYIAIDLDSGDYELANDLLTASRMLKKRRPHSVRFGARVGYPAAFRVGWKGHSADG